MATRLTSRQTAIQTAQKILSENPLFLDTETTGLEGAAEIVEIGLIDQDGMPLFESLVRPAKLIPPEATSIHHITNAMVEKARAWPTLWPTVRSLVIGRTIAAYNADYDLRILQNSLTQYGLSWKDQLKMFCVMKLYAQYRGEWDPRRGNYRYISLDEARRQCRLDLPNAHRAVADALLTRDLLLFISRSDF